VIDRGEPTAHDRRVLILAPTRRDAVVTKTLLAPAGIVTEFRSTLPAMVAALEAGAAAIVIAEESVASPGSGTLADAIAKQPAWSDLPVLVLARPGADSVDVAEAVRTLGNVTVLERPLRFATLLSAVRTAVRARERQYQIRGYLADRVRVEEALRVADRRKDEFLATLGHELRNPLAPMLAALQLLKLGAVTETRSLRAVAVMERQVHHLMRLVDDLLEVSRITRGVIDVQKEPLELGAVLRTAIETSRPLIEAAGQHLTVEIPEQTVPLTGDPVRLTQVFANLLNNASKYSRVGGRIWLKGSKTDQWVVVSVRDDGIGIPPSELTKVFEMFTQVDRSRRRAQGGLGIGLTLVQSLVAMHGGTVEAHSEGSDTGSEFIVRLPLLADSPRRSGPTEGAEPFPPQRILIVDDNRDAAETLSILLAELGATVSVAHSGPEALHALDAFEPHAVLLDIGMPGMDGYEVSRQIRSAGEYAHVLLVALTGWGQDDDRERSERAGFNHHLVKPPDIAQLRSILLAHATRVPTREPRAGRQRRS
jgi:signal transduction histidine kinase/ActR/RegA family two-component response regulator